MAEVVERPSEAEPSHTCVPLHKLFDGPSGSACVGKLSSGEEAGRDVFLRRVEHLSAEELEQEVRAAGMVAHPSVLKVLGLAVSSPSTNGRRTGDLYVVSEFMIGTSLQQIADTARHQRGSLEAGVRLRIVQDLLMAAHDARRILSKSSQWDVRRTIFPDTIWVTDFGAVLLTEVGISQLLHGSPNGSASSSHVGVVEDADVSAAGAILRLLFTDLSSRLIIPAAYRGAVTSILARSECAPNERYSNALDMASAIAELPPRMVASEGEVAAAIGKVMHEELQRQRAGLTILRSGERGRSHQDALPTFDATERPTEKRSAMVPVAEAVERPSREVTRIMPEMRPPALAGSRVPGTGAPDHSNDATDMTRMFVPVFGASGPQATQPAADSQKVPVSSLTQESTTSATLPSPQGEASSHADPESSDVGPAAPRSKLVAMLLVAVLVVSLLLWYAGSY